MKISFIIPHLDFIGCLVSLTCALHCALLPVLVSTLPLMGLGFLMNHWIEYSVTIFGFFLAVFALSHGYRHHHHKMSPLLLTTLGFGIILTGMIFGHHTSEHITLPTGPFQMTKIHTDSIVFMEYFITPLGAMVVGLGHLINWFYIRKSTKGGYADNNITL
ncbi:MerC domain-containing protein [Echinicola marina]|nr:MerC domain-containing protein [Echinicola marina]UCS91692.1 MerC domain-containing protein [Echinicola marina]